MAEPALALVPAVDRARAVVDETLPAAQERTLAATIQLIVKDLSTTDAVLPIAQILHTNRNLRD